MDSKGSPTVSPDPISLPSVIEETNKNKVNIIDNLSLPNSKDDKSENETEMDEEASHQMTTSYSEISFKSGISPETEVSLSLPLDSIPSADHILQRPMSLSYDQSNVNNKLLPLNSEGKVHKEGNMTHFVTEDLEFKIKIASPVSKFSGNSKSGSPSHVQKDLFASSANDVDPNILNELEFEAQKIATSVDTLTENLCGILHSISSITADNVDIYKDAVTKMSDAMDANIKSMYTVMAKTEELSHSMKSVQQLASRLKEIRRLVDLYESL